MGRTDVADGAWPAAIPSVPASCPVLSLPLWMTFWSKQVAEARLKIKSPASIRLERWIDAPSIRPADARSMKGTKEDIDCNMMKVKRTEIETGLDNEWKSLNLSNECTSSWSTAWLGYWIRVMNVGTWSSWFEYSKKEKEISLYLSIIVHRRLVPRNSSN